MKIQYWFVLLISLFFIKCNSSQCGSEINPVATIGFFNDTINNNTTSIQKLTILTLDTALTDSVLINNQTKSWVSLPLNINADTTQFLLKVDAVSDTVTFIYKRGFSSRSTNCEFMRKFDLQNILHTKHILKKVEIKDANIEDSENTTTDEKTISYHLNFYF